MNLTCEQQTAITTPRSISVIASAGTGKTTVLTQRFIHCHLERGTPLFNILAFTFTEKASREMKERILKSPHLDSSLAPLLNVSTIHSFCHSLLKKFGAVIDLKSDFDIFDDEALKLWMHKKTKSYINQKIESNHPCFTKFLKYYGLTHLENTVSNLLNSSQMTLSDADIKCPKTQDKLDHETILKLISEIKDFQDTLLKQRIQDEQLSYDDLEILSLKILDQNNDILKKLQKRYKHILVDEYQDVSPRQFSLIRKLFNPESNEVFIVGDPKQSIYRFRRADYRLFQTMTEIIENHGGETIYLTQTFRTPKKLQDWFNKIFPKALEHQVFQPATTQKQNEQAFIFATPLPEKTEKTALRHKDYASKVALTINELIKNGTPPQEIAILFFARTPIDLYLTEFESQNIPCLTETTTSFFDKPLIQTAWHILNYINGAHDRITQTGILRNPIYAFTEHFIDHLAKSQHSDIFTEQTLDLFASQTERDKWGQLLKQLSYWKKVSQNYSTAETFEIIVREIKPNRTFDEELLTRRFISMMHSWQKQGFYFLKDSGHFINTIDSLDTQFSSTTGHPDGVRLLTIHGAKGLEFDHVFLVPGSRTPHDSPLFKYKQDIGFCFKTHDCDQERTLKYQLEETKDYKAIKEEENALDQEELARLIYVALTRSQKALHFYLERPSQTFINNIDKKPSDISQIKTYNEWLYWLTQIMGQKSITSEMKLESGVGNRNSEVENRESGIESGDVMSEVFLPGTLTVTEIETLTHCAKQFQLRYLDKIRPLKDINPFESQGPSSAKKTEITALERGNLYHEILQYYHPLQNNDLNNIIDKALFNQHLIDTTGKIHKDTHSLIQRLKDNPQFSKFLFDHEESFEELEFSVQLKNFILSGQIDKLTRTTNEQGQSKWTIIDFKTHHAPTEEKRIMLAQQFAFQMSCYALAISKNFNLDQIDTLILFTNGPHSHTIHHTNESLLDFEQSLNKLYQGYCKRLVKNSFELTDNKSICEKCRYFEGNYCGIKTSPLPQTPPTQSRTPSH